MLSNSPIKLKVCGITSSQSIQIAAQKKIKTLGFASNNLLGPNTCDDEKLKEMTAKTEKLINRKIRTLVLDSMDLKKLQNRLDIEHALFIWGNGTMKGNV